MQGGGEGSTALPSFPPPSSTHSPLGTPDSHTPQQRAWRGTHPRDGCFAPHLRQDMKSHVSPTDVPPGPPPRLSAPLPPALTSLGSWLGSAPPAPVVGAPVGPSSAAQGPAAAKTPRERGVPGGVPPSHAASSSSSSSTGPANSEQGCSLPSWGRNCSVPPDPLRSPPTLAGQPRQLPHGHPGQPQVPLVLSVLFVGDGVCRRVWPRVQVGSSAGGRGIPEPKTPLTAVGVPLPGSGRPRTRLGHPRFSLPQDECPVGSEPSPPALPPALRTPSHSGREGSCLNIVSTPLKRYQVKELQTQPRFFFIL